MFSQAELPAAAEQLWENQRSRQKGGIKKGNIGPGPNDPQQLPACFLASSYNVTGETNRSSTDGGVRMTGAQGRVSEQSLDGSVPRLKISLSPLC